VLTARHCCPPGARQGKAGGKKGQWETENCDEAEGVKRARERCKV